MKSSENSVCEKYARAFLAAGGNFAQRKAEIESAARSLSDYLKVLSHPCLSPDIKFEILNKINQSKKHDKYLDNFLRLLILNKRISLLSKIAQTAAEIADEAEGFKRVDAESRFDLSEEDIKTLKEALSSAFGKKIRLTVSKKEDLIGGLRIKAGDILIDGSVKGRLEALKKKTLT